MAVKKLFLLIFLSFSFFGMSQSFSGIVIDSKTKLPVESASIYFDNTTIGTTTNQKGAFTISYNDAVQSPLIISYLGFETVSIFDYRQKNNITIELKASLNTLDRVIVNANDGLTRRQKLRLFRKQFLGSSQFSKTCKILNEDDLVLRYNKREKTLSVSAISPVLIQNKALQYLVSYDIVVFDLEFRYVEEKNNIFNIKQLTFAGNMFYKNLEKFNKRKAEKNRIKAYNGSVLQFMRALYNEDLEASNYQIYHKRFITDPWKHFKIKPIEDSTLKEVLLDKKVTILYDKEYQSDVTFLNSEILIDVYGNFTDVTSVLFSGHMGRQRVGSLLPLDFNLKD